MTKMTKERWRLNLDNSGKETWLRNATFDGGLYCIVIANGIQHWYDRIIEKPLAKKPMPAMRNNVPVASLGPYGCHNRTLAPVGTHSQDSTVQWPARYQMGCMYLASADDVRCNSCKHQKEKTK